MWGGYFLKSGKLAFEASQLLEEELLKGELLALEGLLGLSQALCFSYEVAAQYLPKVEELKLLEHSKDFITLLSVLFLSGFELLEAIELAGAGLKAVKSVSQED